MFVLSEADNKANKRNSCSSWSLLCCNAVHIRLWSRTLCRDHIELEIKCHLLQIKFGHTFSSEGLKKQCKRDLS